MIVAARLRPYALPLIRPWVAASAVLTRRRGMLLRLETSDGFAGWGDCAPLPSSGETGHRRVFEALEALAATLPGRPVDKALDGIGMPEVRWAVETAGLDLLARRRGIALHRLLGGEAAPEIAVNAALGPLDAGCAKRAAAALEQGFSIGKIKVGLASTDTELRMLRDLNDRLEGRLRLRLDANRAWDTGQAHGFLTGLSGLPVDGIEEPLAAPTLAGLGRLQDTVSFAVAVDESLVELGLGTVIAAGAVRRLVVKPARLGGMRRSLDLAVRARDAGMELVLTSVVDSAIGVAAAAHLAAALPLPATHGLATSPWLAEDVCPPPIPAGGKLELPDGAGLGLFPIEPPA